MATIADLLVKLRMDGSGLDSGMEESGSKLKKWSETARNTGKAMTVGLTLPIVAMGGVAVKWAADLEESINKTDVLFGTSANGVKRWSEDSATSLGMSQQASLDYTSSFAGMLNTVADGPKQLAGMSTNLTQLTADFASFHNLNPEEAFTVIASGLAGEAEAIRRYGVDMSAANVEQVAMSMGLADTAANLTAQDKALARYHILLNETTEEQGDFARTSKSVSNQMKIARARVQDVGVSFGKILLPYVQQALMAFGDLLDKFESLDPKWQKIILVVAAVAAAMGPLLIILGTMLPALGAIGAVIGLILSPIGLLVIAIAALIGLGIYAWANDLWGVRDAVSGLMDVLELFRPALDDLIDAFQALREGDWDEVFYELRDAVLTFANVFMAEVVPRVLAGLAAVGQAILDWIGSVDWLGVLQTVGNALINGIRAGAEFAWPYVLEFFENIPGWIQAGLTFLWEEVLKPAGGLLIAGLQSGIDQYWPTVSIWLLGLPEKIIAAVPDLLALLLQKGRDLLTGLWNGIQEYWPMILGWLLFLPMLIFTAIGDVLRTLRQKGLDLLAGLWDGLKDKWAEVKAWVSLMGTYVFWAIGDVLRILRQKGLDLMAGLWDGILDKWASVKSWVSGIGGYVSTDVGDLSTILYSAGEAIMNGLWDGAKAVWESISGWLSDKKAQIESLKGPVREDYKILIPAGRAIMAGLGHGLDVGWSSVSDQLQGYNPAIAQSISGGDFSAGSGGNGGGNTYNVFTLRSDEFLSLMAKAENGDMFARSFASELGLRVGAP